MEERNANAVVVKKPLGKWPLRRRRKRRRRKG
jgi:hypothetical protein